MENQKTIFTFEIDILPEKKYVILSPRFASSSGCKWYAAVSLNGGHLSMHLLAEPLRPGSVITAIWSFRLWDTPGNHLFRSHEVCTIFEDGTLGWSHDNILSLSDKKKLIIKVEVKVVKLTVEESKSSTARAKVLSLEQKVSDDLKVELDKERAKSATSNVVAWLKNAFSFSHTMKTRGFWERTDDYQLLLPS